MTDGPLVFGLKGLDARNLGSHMMALAVRQAFPHAILALPIRTPAPALHRLLAPTAVWSWADVGGPSAIHATNHFMARGMGQRAFRTANGEPLRVNAVLDISGYSYGEPMKPGTTVRMAGWTTLWEKAGIPTLLLPQSFGSFTRSEAVEAMGTVIDHASLVFARDHTSYENLKAVRPDATIHQAPDIAIPVAAARYLTGGVAGLPAHPYGVLLPNRQVVRKTGVDLDDYVKAMASIADAMSAAGLEVLVAAHEGGNDDELVAAVAATGMRVREFGAPEVDLMLRLIRSSEVVVSSRYHGAVAALANGIPTMTVGWAEKYQTLMDEFSVPDLCVSVTEPDFAGRATDLVRGILDDVGAARARLAEHDATRLDRIERAWDLIERAATTQLTGRQKAE